MTILETNELHYEDFQDFYDAGKNFVAEMNTSIGPDGNPIWSIHRYDALLGEPLRCPTGADLYNQDKRTEFEQSVRDRLNRCPDTVDKSLWRQALLNHMHGLYGVGEVCRGWGGIYQVRGYDLANMTIVEIGHGFRHSDKWVVIIDCTTDKETANAALDFYRQYRKCSFGIRAIILTHSHVDHYGGIKGVLTDDEEDVPIIAPEHFLQEAALENAIVGDAMARRSTYQYGTLLEAAKIGNADGAAKTDGKVDAGLGKDIQRGGTVGFATPGISVIPNPENKPNDTPFDQAKTIYEGAELSIGNLHFEFMLCPGTEAPAEMTVWIKEYQTLVAAEIATHTLHNLLTPRGAEVRDARLWWKAIDKLIERYGTSAKCICATHHWPITEDDQSGRIVDFLEGQRDSYKFLHDQTVRLMNQGYTMLEIADWFDKPEHLPGFMKGQWHNRGYYGTISHDVRAIYQKYLGWYDMNPSNLNPLPPEKAARKYISAIGEQRAYDILKRTLSASISSDPDSYRFAAEIGRHLVLADCGGEKKRDYRDTLAKIYRALGSRCEAGTWRNMYLVGAKELENGGPLSRPSETSVNQYILNAMDEELFYDFLASRWNAVKALKSENGGPWRQVFRITEVDIGTMMLEAADGVLKFRSAAGISTDKDVISFKLHRDTFSGLATGRKHLDEEWNVTIWGREEDKEDIRRLFDTFDKTLPDFEIVLPKEPGAYGG